MAARNRARNKEEFMGNAALIVEPLNNGLSSLPAAVKSDDYVNGKGDLLEFLNVLKETGQRAIPFWPVLKLIPVTHTEGYQGE